MILLKHLGIYCMDAKRVTDFYINVFNMKLIVDNQIQDDDLIQDLLSSYEMGGVIKKSVKLFKVITEKGCLTKEGDMLELYNLKILLIKKINIFTKQVNCIYVLELII